MEASACRCGRTRRWHLQIFRVCQYPTPTPAVWPADMGESSGTPGGREPGGADILVGNVFFVIWDQRTAGFRRLIFFEMRDAAAPAFKRTYIGQCAETLRPSNQSHVLSATWTQRQLGPRAFSIYDEARFSAIHARLHCLPLLVEQSLAVVEAREHTIQTCAKTRTDGALIHYKRVGHRSPPPRYNERHERLRAAGDQMDCVICTDAVNPAKCPKRSIPESPRSECVGPVGSFAYR